MYQNILEYLNIIEGEYQTFKQEVIKDYWICLVSRECSLLGRREVLTGKAKFGILGDGKEVPQVAMARAFQKGDFRSGYYRDQTFMMALGLCSVQDYFAQLYADPENDPFSGGRQMNAHFSSPLIHRNGQWMDHSKLYNVSSDISSTGGQMARALGLALASKHYRKNDNQNNFSNKGNEVSFCTIGDASTSEGVFWETLNAACVLQVPLAVSVWDDGYGISVPIDLQTVKKSISEALSGFQSNDQAKGLSIFKAKAWNYPELVNIYKTGIDVCRNEHTPVMFHIQEVTQPQGHSTSGSHERYKSKQRLDWEIEMDCIGQMEKWMLENSIADEALVAQFKDLSKQYVREEKAIAWNKYITPILEQKEELIRILNSIGFEDEIHQLNAIKEPSTQELVECARNCLLAGGDNPALIYWIEQQYQLAKQYYHADVYSETSSAANKIQSVPPIFSSSSPELNGYQILNQFFDIKFKADERLLAFGEDLGKIGDVNQGFAGLQDKYGDDRIFDCGIREWTIIGQAIGLSMRGLRPIAEIQYLDYIVYALSALMDDLATVRYRSGGRQMAPAIIRTRGHRLEGIWHSGSPIGMLLHALRGICICVPRNMTQAAGMYNSLLQSDDPGLVIECLNGYRLKEKLPDNLDQFTVALGKVEVIVPGTDITLVTYGSCVRIAETAVERLRAHQISVELIDAQTLLPFDTDQDISKSLMKTHKLFILDEDVPGGASAYLLQQIIEVQNAFQFLDAQPKTLSATQNRPPYGSTGDYFTKPNVEDVVMHAIQMMHEYDPTKYPMNPKFFQ